MLRIFYMYWGDLAVTVVLLGVFLCSLAITQHRDAQRLETAGVRTEAQILTKEIVDNSRYDGKERPSFRVTYRFSTSAGPQQRSRDVKRSFYDGVEVGDFIMVLYWADDPSLHTFGPSSRRQAAWNTGTFGGAIILFGMLLCGCAVYFAFRASAALRRGPRVPATVTGRGWRFRVNAPTRFQLKRRARVRWRYELDGKTYQGKSVPQGIAPFEKYPIGEEITVCCDPDRPGRSWFVDELEGLI